MTHLTTQEFVDHLDGELPAGRASHLDACDVCRTQADELQSLLAGVKTSAAIPEPSPLFWDHLSARVREAVAHEPVAPHAAWWQPRWPAFVVLTTALACVLAVAFVAHRGDMPSPSVRAAVTTAVDPADADLVATDSEIGSVNVVAAVADGLSWDDAKAANLVPARATVEEAVAQLTEAQRRELVRLVRQEMGGAE